MIPLGKLLILFGGVLVLVGIVVMLAGRANLPLGRLSGDIVYRGKNTSFYFPIVTCIVLSVLLSFIMWIIGKLR
jgi:Protein of unknown function (DUF2905)